MYLHFELVVFLVRFIYIPYKATTRRLDVWQSSKHSSELRDIGYYDIRIKMKITTIKAICGATSFPKFLGSPPLFLNTDNINISIFIKVYSKKCFMGVIMFVMVVECAVFTSAWCSCKGWREAEKITTPTPITFTRKRNKDFVHFQSNSRFLNFRISTHMEIWEVICMYCCINFVHLLSKPLIKQSESGYYIMNRKEGRQLKKVSCGIN